MIDWFGFIIFILIGSVSCTCSMKLLKTRITLTNAATMPYLLICILQVLVCSIYKFRLPSLEYWLILSIFICVLFISECISQAIITKGNFSCKFSPLSIPDIYQNDKFFNYFITFIILFAFVISIEEINKVDVALLLQDEFQDEFQSSKAGSLYTRLSLIILSVYLFSFRKKFKWRILGTLALFPNLLVNTKGIIFIILLAVLTVLLMYNKIKNIPKLIFFISLSGVIIFFGSYAYEGFLSNWDMSDGSFFEKISIKLSNYLLAGVQAFSYNISHSGEYVYSQLSNATLVPINSFLSKFGLTKYYSAVADYTVPIGFPGSYSNVNTMFGTLYLYNGLIGGSVLLFFWTSLTCIVRHIALKTQNPFDMILFALYYSAFLLGWFEYYFMHTFWIYLILISCFFKYIIGKIKFFRKDSLYAKL